MELLQGLFDSIRALFPVTSMEYMMIVPALPLLIIFPVWAFMSVLADFLGRWFP